MSWAASYIAKLKIGETVSFRPRGNSMQGKLNLDNFAPLNQSKIMTL